MWRCVQFNRTCFLESYGKMYAELHEIWDWMDKSTERRIEFYRFMYEQVMYSETSLTTNFANRKRKFNSLDRNLHLIQCSRLVTIPTLLFLKFMYCLQTIALNINAAFDFLNWLNLVSQYPEIEYILYQL